jgi:hypothetical protein
VLGLLQRLAHGSLTVRLPDDSVRHFGAAPGSSDLTASLTLRNWEVCKAALKSGDIGFAESYIAGDWTTPNLVELIKVFIANRRAIEDVVYGSWFGRLVYRVRHLMHRNSKAGSSAQHPRALRPGQCLLQALAGRDDELFVGLVRGRPRQADARSAARQGAPRARAWRA